MVREEREGVVGEEKREGEDGPTTKVGSGRSADHAFPSAMRRTMSSGVIHCGTSIDVERNGGRAAHTIT